MKPPKPIARRTPLKRSTKPLKRSSYRALRADEPDPETAPLIYDTTDGRRMKRWKIGPREYVERVVRDDEGRPVRSRPLRAHRIDVADARRRYEAGESLPEISRALGCDTGNLSRALRRQGVRMRAATEYATPIDSAEVVERYRKGETPRHIARALGVSGKRVQDLLYSTGTKNRRTGRPKGRGTRGGRVSFDSEFDAMKPSVHARSGGRCEARVSPRCTGRAAHVHHRRMRSQGGTNDLANLLDSCHPCHSWIHANPAESYERGLLLRGGGEP